MHFVVISRFRTVYIPVLDFYGHFELFLHIYVISKKTEFSKKNTCFGKEMKIR